MIEVCVFLKNDKKIGELKDLLALYELTPVLLKCGDGYLLVGETDQEGADRLSKFFEDTDLLRLEVPVEKLAEAYLNGVRDIETYSQVKRYAIMFCQSVNHDLRIIDDDALDRLAVNEAEHSGWGWQRVKIFLSGVTLPDDYYYIDGAGNAQNILKDNLECWLEEIIENLENE